MYLMIYGARGRGAVGRMYLGAILFIFCGHLVGDVVWIT